MNIVDSSGWVEYLAGGPNAGFFATPIVALPELIVSTVTVFEVFRLMLRQRGEAAAEHAAMTLRQGQVVDVDYDLAIHAAALAHAHKLAMADSLILATARQFNATLWTQDVDFDGLEKVKYRPKAK